MESFFHLNWLDIVIICLLFAGMINGLTKGLIVSVFDAVGIFAALFGAKYLSAPISTYVINNTNFANSIKTMLDKKVALAGIQVFSLFKSLNIKIQTDTKELAALFISAVCFIILFFFIMALINIVKRALKITISHTPLKYFDRLGGAAIGIIISAIFIFIFFALITPLVAVLPSDKGLALAIRTSKFANYFYLYNFIIPWLQKLYPVI